MSRPVRDDWRASTTCVFCTRIRSTLSRQSCRQYLGERDAGGGRGAQYSAFTARTPAAHGLARFMTSSDLGVQGVPRSMIRWIIVNGVAGLSDAVKVRAFSSSRLSLCEDHGRWGLPLTLGRASWGPVWCARGPQTSSMFPSQAIVITGRGPLEEHRRLHVGFDWSSSRKGRSSWSVDVFDVGKQDRRPWWMLGSIALAAHRRPSCLLFLHRFLWSVMIVSLWKDCKDVDASLQWHLFSQATLVQRSGQKQHRAAISSPGRAGSHPRRIELLSR